MSTYTMENTVVTELKLSLENVGFTLKGFTFSGKDPNDKLSADKKSVSVRGLKWYSKEVYVMINVHKLNFAQ